MDAMLVTEVVDGRAVRMHVQSLPEGVYLATSSDVQGLVAQGRTLEETLEIARDVTQNLRVLRTLRG